MVQDGVFEEVVLLVVMDLETVEIVVLSISTVLMASKVFHFELQLG